MNKRLQSLLAALFAVSAVTVSLAGCNTMQGAGEDLEQAGQELEEEVEQATD